MPLFESVPVFAERRDVPPDSLLYPGDGGGDAAVERLLKLAIMPLTPLPCWLLGALDKRGPRTPPTCPDVCLVNPDLACVKGWSSAAESPPPVTDGDGLRA